MRVLALDTTTRNGSVALVDDDVVVDERQGDASRTHAERLPGELAAILTAHALAWNDIDLFGVASGPGSFTGLRIGIATMQGLALTTRRRLVAVSALEALAQHGSQHAPAGTFVAAWMDAHRREVFAALYRVADAATFSPERLVEIEGPTVGDPAATLARWVETIANGSVIFLGDGATLYRETIQDSSASRRQVHAPPVLAGGIGRMAAVRARRGETVHPAAVHPLYVRRPDAVLDRERKNV